jgi:acyl carrier protein
MGSLIEQELKTLIIDVLELEDLAADDIDSDAPLFGGTLGLDSIDALELAVALSKRYGVTLAADDPSTRLALTSISALARYLEANPRHPLAVPHDLPQ